MAPRNPLVRTFLGSTDQEILEVAAQVYRGQYEVAPSILHCRHQDQFMAKLYEELSKHLVRVGLCGATGTAWSLSRGRRHSQTHSPSQTRSPLVDSRRKEVAKGPRGDSLIRSLWSHSRHNRIREWQHQSQSPGHQQPNETPPWASMRRPHRHTLMSPFPARISQSVSPGFPH